MGRWKKVRGSTAVVRAGTSGASFDGAGAWQDGSKPSRVTVVASLAVQAGRRGGLRLRTGTAALLAIVLIGAATPSAGVAASGGWSVVSSPNVGGSLDRLQGATCTTPSDCWAVGSYFNPGLTSTLTEHYDGHEWSIVGSPNVTGAITNELVGVACASSTNCWAVGSSQNPDRPTGQSPPQTLIEHYDGHEWKVFPSPPTNPTASLDGERLFAVTCVSEADCWAVGFEEKHTLVEHYEGKEWKVFPSPEVTQPQPGEQLLKGVTCTGASDCWAAGDNRSTCGPECKVIFTLTEHYDGKQWIVVPSPNPAQPTPNLTGFTENGLNGVSCASSRYCVAVGGYGFKNSGEEGAEGTLILQNTGSGWSVVSNPGQGSGPHAVGGGLMGVSCSAGKFCVATEDNGVIEQSSGGAWTIAASGSLGAPKQLSAAACTSGCFAVGSSEPGSITEERTLIEQFTGPDPTETTLSCSPAPDVVSQPTTCTATVADPLIPGNTPGGTVSFGSSGSGSFSNAGTCTLSAGSCQLTYTPSALGTDQITASYAGDADHETSSGSSPLPVQLPPTVTTVSPRQGPVLGGTIVSITGTNFTGATAVKFGSVNAASFTVHSATRITAVAPVAPAGRVDVTVTNGDVASPITLADRFAFTPIITGVNPNGGPTTGGTTVTVSGAGFVPGGTIIRFGVTNGTSVSCTSTTQCTVVSPAHLAGAVNVKATVNKVSGPSTAGFMYE